MTTRALRISIIVLLALGVTVFHYGTNAQAGTTHDILQRVYYVPIILAGLWFGVRGGLITAFLITLAYFPHARHGWYAPYSELFQISEMVMYHVIGALCGVLSTREKKALGAERRSREAKERALDDLKAQTSQLFELEEQLRRADRLAALGTLSAGLAHEIRNPLGSIVTSAELLAESRGSGELKDETGEGEEPDFLDIILEESRRLEKIVANFLEFARQERRDPDSEPGVCRADEAVDRTVELLRPHLEKREIEIRLDDRVEGADVAICRSHLQQVLLNLLLNALEAVERRGWIRIGIEDGAGQVRLAVEDSGPGVPEELAERIFDPFVTTREQGTGLGLSIADRILSSHGGSIQLDRGHRPLNRFVLDLPKG